MGQDPVLFDASIADNIAYSRGGLTRVSMAEVREVAEQANAASFIEELPQGYNTLVGSQGMLLSGGLLVRWLCGSSPEPAAHECGGHCRCRAM